LVSYYSLTFTLPPIGRNHIQRTLCKTVVVRSFREEALPGYLQAAISGRFPLPIKDYGHPDEKPDSGSKRYQT